MRPVVSHWQTLSHNVVWSIPHRPIIIRDVIIENIKLFFNKKLQTRLAISKYKRSSIITHCTSIRRQI